MHNLPNTLLRSTIGQAISAAIQSGPTQADWQDARVIDRLAEFVIAALPKDRHHYHDDPEQQWAGFWAEIVAPNGTLDIEQVKLELSDFSMLMSYMSHVYDHATGGRISKPNTPPSVVCSVINEHINQIVEHEVADRLREAPEDATSSALIAYPPTLTPELADVLGLMNFQVCPLAALYRHAGHVIERNAEAEQAFMLDRLIRMVIEHSTEWFGVYKAELSLMRSALAPKVQP